MTTYIIMTLICLVVLLISLFLVRKSQRKILKLETSSLFEKINELNNTTKLTVSIDKPKESISYTDWYEKKYGKSSIDYHSRYWNEYWDEVLADEYYALAVRMISRYPKFLVNLITEIQKFDFEKVSEFMKANHWTWNHRKESPTVKQMIDNIFSLAENLTEQNDKNGYSSGGFEVKRMTDDKAEITFSFQND